MADQPEEASEKLEAGLGTVFHEKEVTGDVPTENGELPADNLAEIVGKEKEDLKVSTPEKEPTDISVEETSPDVEPPAPSEEIVEPAAAEGPSPSPVVSGTVDVEKAALPGEGTELAETVEETPAPAEIKEIGEEENTTTEKALPGGTEEETNVIEEGDKVEEVPTAEAKELGDTNQEEAPKEIPESHVGESVPAAEAKEAGDTLEADEKDAAEPTAQVREEESPATGDSTEVIEELTEISTGEPEDPVPATEAEPIVQEETGEVVEEETPLSAENPGESTVPEDPVALVDEKPSDDLPKDVPIIAEGETNEVIDKDGPTTEEPVKGTEELTEVSTTAPEEPAPLIGEVSLSQSPDDLPSSEDVPEGVPTIAPEEHKEGLATAEPTESADESKFFVTEELEEPARVQESEDVPTIAQVEAEETLDKESPLTEESKEIGGESIEVSGSEPEEPLQVEQPEGIPTIAPEETEEALDVRSPPVEESIESTGEPTEISAGAPEDTVQVEGPEDVPTIVPEATEEVVEGESPTTEDLLETAGEPAETPSLPEEPVHVEEPRDATATAPETTEVLQEEVPVREESVESPEEQKGAPKIMAEETPVEKQIELPETLVTKEEEVAVSGQSDVVAGLPHTEGSLKSVETVHAEQKVEDDSEKSGEPIPTVDKTEKNVGRTPGVQEEGAPVPAARAENPVEVDELPRTRSFFGVVLKHVSKDEPEPRIAHSTGVEKSESAPEVPLQSIPAEKEPTSIDLGSGEDDAKIATEDVTAGVKTRDEIPVHKDAEKTKEIKSDLAAEESNTTTEDLSTQESASGSQPTLSVLAAKHEGVEGRTAEEASPTMPHGQEESLATTPRGTPLMQRVEQLEQKLAELEGRHNPMSEVASTGASTPRSVVERPVKLSTRYVLEETGSKGTLLDRVTALEQKLAYATSVKFEQKSAVSMPSEESTPVLAPAVAAEPTNEGASEPPSTPVTETRDWSPPAKEDESLEKKAPEKTLTVSSEEKSKTTEDPVKVSTEEKILDPVKSPAEAESAPPVDNPKQKNNKSRSAVSKIADLFKGCCSPGVQGVKNEEEQAV